MFLNLPRFRGHSTREPTLTVTTSKVTVLFCRPPLGPASATTQLPQVKLETDFGEKKERKKKRVEWTGKIEFSSG